MLLIDCHTVEFIYSRSFSISWLWRMKSPITRVHWQVKASVLGDNWVDRKLVMRGHKSTYAPTPSFQLCIPFLCPPHSSKHNLNFLLVASLKIHMSYRFNFPNTDMDDISHNTIWRSRCHSCLRVEDLASTCQFYKKLIYLSQKEYICITNRIIGREI